MDLARRATRIILEDFNLAAVGFLRINYRDKMIRPYAYASRANPALISEILQKPLTTLKVPLGRIYSNLTENTLNTGQTNISLSLGDFGFRMATRQLQRVLGTNFHISIPIKTKKQVEGALICAAKQKRLDERRIASLKTTANQLGLALENIIAHEKIMERYLKELDQNNKPTPKQIKKKFTLRITPEIDQYLSYKTANTKESKANYVRKLLENLISQDKDYHQFTNLK